MPKEDRRIIFSHDEVYNAVYKLSAQKQIPKPPPGAVTSVEEKEGDSSQFIMRLKNPAEETEDTREYSRDFLAAALMLFCRGLGIPLPKSARKSVMISGEGSVVLRVQI